MTGDRARRVVVTGVGLVSPCGSGFDAFADAVMNGRSAGRALEPFDGVLYPTRIAAQVPVSDRTAIGADPLARPFVEADDLKTAYGIVAARRALADAGWPEGRPAPDRIAVILGTGLSSVSCTELEQDWLPYLSPDGALDLPRLGREVLRRTTAQSPRRHLTDEANRAIAGLAGAQGVSLSHFGACAASTQAVGDAFRRIRDGSADAAIAGGLDSMVHPFGMMSFMLLGALSTRNDAPGGACRPFHRDRDGFLLGEGAAVLVLEHQERARSRGARIYGEITGYGSSVDGYNVTAPRPDGAGALAAMRHALRDAGIGPAEVGYVNAHGTGTALNDPAEANAVRALFGERGVPISSVKPVFGHAIAAAGAFEVVACLAAMAAGAIPPTPNLTAETVDPECRGLDHVLGGAREGCPEVLMTNNYGFGGQNASLLLRRV